jgi:hypothetical protein
LASLLHHLAYLLQQENLKLFYLLKKNIST